MLPDAAAAAGVLPDEAGPRGGGGPHPDLAGDGHALFRLLQLPRGSEDDIAGEKC